MTDLAADPVRDEAYRKHARALARHLLEKVSSITTSPEAMSAIANVGYAMADIDVTRADTIVDPVELGLPSRIRFTLVLQRYREPIAGFGVDPQTREQIVILNLLPRDAPEAARNRNRSGRKLLQRYLNRQFVEYEDVIVHEFIHMFDYMRGNPTFEQKATYQQATGREQFVLYYNNPEEFNAHFQQIVVVIENILDDLPPTKRDIILRNFDSFMSVVNRINTVVAMRHALAPEWERKFDTRLWQTWQHLKERRGR